MLLGPRTRHSPALLESPRIPTKHSVTLTKRLPTTNGALAWLPSNVHNGFLTFCQVPFRKTPDLTDCGGQCAAADPTLEPLLREAQELTDYASAFRYPDAPYEPDSAEAEMALAVATQLCAQVELRLAARGSGKVRRDPELG